MIHAIMITTLTYMILIAMRLAMLTNAQYKLIIFLVKGVQSIMLVGIFLLLLHVQHYLILTVM